MNHFRYGAIRRQDTSERYQQRQRELQERREREMQRAATVAVDSSSDSDMDVAGGGGVGRGGGSEPPMVPDVEPELAVEPVAAPSDTAARRVTYKTTAQLSVDGGIGSGGALSPSSSASSGNRRSSLPPAPPEMAPLQAFTSGRPPTCTSSSFAGPSQPAGSSSASGGFAGAASAIASASNHSSGAIPKRPNKQIETRQRQLEALRRMEERIRSLGDHNRSKPQPEAPMDPPKKSCSCYRLSMHVLDIGRAVSDNVVTWLDVASSVFGGASAPEETILYSLVRGRSELIMFGGIQKDVSSMTSRQQQHQSSTSNTVSNAVYFLRPPVDPAEW